jgi:hypothetical protein
MRRADSHFYLPAFRERAHAFTSASPRTGAGLGDYDLAADVVRQLALQYIVALMLPAVGLQRDHHAWRKAPLHDRNRTLEAF